MRHSRSRDIDLLHVCLFKCESTFLCPSILMDHYEVSWKMKHASIVLFLIHITYLNSNFRMRIDCCFLLLDVSHLTLMNWTCKIFSRNICDYLKMWFIVGFSHHLPQYIFIFTCCSVDDGFPTVTLHFQNSLTLTVYPHEYLFPFVSKLCYTSMKWI